MVDSHAHLDSCDAEPEALVAEAVAAGVERIVTVGVGRDGSDRAIALAEAHPEVYATVGIHPHDADAYTPADDAWIRALAQHPRVVAIGECGLDHYRGLAAPEAQRRAFRAQIAIAAELGLPLVIHSRAAARETLELLAADADGLTVVLHCFSMEDRVPEVIAHGYHASFAGQLTFPRADALRAAARALPADRLLVETDSPYLAPVPRRGRPNRPAWVAHTLACLSEVRGEPIEHLDELISRNAARVFGW